MKIKVDTDRLKGADLRKDRARRDQYVQRPTDTNLQNPKRDEITKWIKKKT